MVRDSVLHTKDVHHSRSGRICDVRGEVKPGAVHATPISRLQHRWDTAVAVVEDISTIVGHSAYLEHSGFPAGWQFSA
jgi:hypothetical protein